MDWTMIGAPPPIWIALPLRSLRKMGRVNRRFERGTIVSSTVFTPLVYRLARQDRPTVKDALNIEERHEDEDRKQDRHSDQVHHSLPLRRDALAAPHPLDDDE